MMRWRKSSVGSGRGRFGGRAQDARRGTWASQDPTAQTSKPAAACALVGRELTCFITRLKDHRVAVILETTNSLKGCLSIVGEVRWMGACFVAAVPGPLSVDLPEGVSRLPHYLLRLLAFAYELVVVSSLVV